MPDNPTPEMLKKIRADTSPERLSSPTALSPINDDPSQDDRKPRKATVQDVEDEDDDMGREFAPGGDADYFVEEDSEGRFFGGGLTSEQKDILNIFDNAGGEGALGDVCVSLWDGVDLILLKLDVSWKNCLSLAFGDCFCGSNELLIKIRINVLNILMIRLSKHHPPRYFPSS
jgi:beta-catenin-like protein 1